MTEVLIPFKPQFQESMLTGKKTMTSRTKRYGNVGDTFNAFNAKFEITKVYQYKLDCVAWLHHREEGFDTAEDFMKCWAQIHPQKGYVAEQEVWVHEFKKLDALNENPY